MPSKRLIKLVMTRVAVNTDILKWAMDRSRHPSGFLESKFPNILKWMMGKDQPTFRQLEKLAKATATPFGYFFLSEPPVEMLSMPIPHFRTENNSIVHKPSPELLETVQMMERRQAWLREIMIEDAQETLPFVGSHSDQNNPQKTVSSIRDALGFKENWASDQKNWYGALRVLREAIEKIGIFVVVNGIVGNNTYRKLDVIEFRGFVLVDEYAPLVFVNGTDSKAAQMFTLAHELAHIWFGFSAAFDLREMRSASEPREQACDKVAAEFLVPENTLRQIWSTLKKDSDPFQEIARQFKVTEVAAARRALDLQLIELKQFYDFYHAYRDKEQQVHAKTTVGGNFYSLQNLRIGKRFAGNVFRAVEEGRLLYREAYQLTGLYGNTFAKYAKELGYKGIR